MPLVKTTMQPYLVQKVSESEYLDLERQGLVHSVVPDYTAPKAAKAEATNKKEGSE